jgi:hypothetical protein
MFKVNDIVRVAAQPKNRCAYVKGEVGRIEKIVILEGADHANLVSVQESGKRSGWGSVPVSCLEIETDPKWFRALLVMDEAQAAYEKKAMAYSDGVNALYRKVVKDASEKFGLPEERITDIFNYMEKFYRGPADSGG